jgi:hypothetical protein
MFRQTASSFTFLLLLSIFTLHLFDPLTLKPIFAQAPFYQGKTIQVVVGSAPGGLYDQWGRLLAKSMGKYIAGNPNMIVQNMPGGGSPPTISMDLPSPTAWPSACFKRTCTSSNWSESRK